VESAVRGLHEKAVVFNCTQYIRGLTPFHLWKNFGSTDEPFPPGQRVLLVAALGNPGRFHRDMERSGFDVCGALFFRDHYRLTSRDWDHCVKQARNRSAAAIVTTEKDAAKIARPPDFPLMVSVQQTEVSGSSSFALAVKNAIDKARK
ncbi:MAG TPA: tetraacyldisaccharide 4'-kinase, partial [Acidobacteriota bacterium]|nr:tetraacyldisaccharide 4'-kinase [Acidobacteriota bacterium]